MTSKWRWLISVASGCVLVSLDCFLWGLFFMIVFVIFTSLLMFLMFMLASAAAGVVMVIRSWRSIKVLSFFVLLGFVMRWLIQVLSKILMFVLELYRIVVVCEFLFHNIRIKNSCFSPWHIRKLLSVIGFLWSWSVPKIELREIVEIIAKF